MDHHEERNSIVYGHPLDKDTFDEFIERLRYHVRGNGVNDHCTADAIFLVKEEVTVTGIDLDYATTVVYCDEEGNIYPTLKEAVDSYDDDMLIPCIESEMMSIYEKEPDFVNDDTQIIDIIYDNFGWSITKTGSSNEFRYVSTHLTMEAAEAFIQRNKHNHKKLVIYVDSRYRSNEFNAIINGLLDGKIVFQP